MSKTSPDFYDDIKALRREVRALKASKTITNTIDRIFPIGSIYLTTLNHNPASQLAGEWTLDTTDDQNIYYWRRTA